MTPFKNYMTPFIYHINTKDWKDYASDRLGESLN